MRISTGSYIYLVLVLTGFAGVGFLCWLGLDLMTVGLRRRAVRIGGQVS